MRIERTIGGLAACLALVACQAPVRTYSGPQRPAHDVAQLAAERGRFVAFEGESLFTREIEALPGSRRMKLRFNLSGDEIARGVREDDRAMLYCDGRATLAAGTRYRLRSRASQAVRRQGAATRYAHTVEIRDEQEQRILAHFDCGWQESITFRERERRPPRAR